MSNILLFIPVKSKTYTYYVGLFGVLAFVLLASPVPVSAETVLRTDNTVAIETEQTVNGDFYVAAQKMSMSGRVAGDLFSVSRTATVNGPVEGDVFILADTAQMHADVGDDVRIAGGEVTIAENVGGDLFVFAGTLNVLSSATIEGDIYFFGGDAILNGHVNGSVHGASRDLRIDGAIQGDVDVSVSGMLVLGSRANIEGFVSYKSPTPVVRAQDAVVVGEVTHTKAERESKTLREMLIPPFVLLFATLLVYLFGRKKLGFLVTSIKRHYVLVSLVGLSSLVLIPIGSIILSVSVLGLVVGILGLFLFGFLSILSVILLGPIVGYFVHSHMYPESEPTLITVVFGTIAVYLVSLVPVAGSFLLMAGFILVFGSVVYYIFQSFR